MTTELKLKRCPFCDGPAEFTAWTDYSTQYRAGCRSNVCMVSPETRSSFDTKEQAAAVWNRRLAPKTEGANSMMGSAPGCGYGITLGKLCPKCGKRHETPIDAALSEKP